MLLKKYINQLSYEVAGCAIEVHKQLGPGLLESIYETCLIEELKLPGLKVFRQLLFPINLSGKIYL
jgi:GxxExxY protein